MSPYTKDNPDVQRCNHERAIMQFCLPNKGLLHSFALRYQAVIHVPPLPHYSNIIGKKPGLTHHTLCQM